MNVNSLYDMFFDAFPLRRKRSSDFIVPAVLGFGVGAAIGVGLGMIFAPQSGETTRQQLRESAMQLKEKAQRAAHRARREIAEKANGITEPMSYDTNPGLR